MENPVQLFRLNVRFVLQQLLCDLTDQVGNICPVQHSGHRSHQHRIRAKDLHLKAAFLQQIQMFLHGRQLRFVQAHGHRRQQQLAVDLRVPAQGFKIHPLVGGVLVNII